ncbi:DNA-methyltransferase [Saccharicrinis sp. FJH54]|uniref:DNA-methyltransferase n=1 Tax=Saccharicrinis sp. FJH54 TaxID=3344665 RepID=UPI0035D425D9
MSKNKFFEKRCEKFMADNLISKGQKVDLIITSPPYNIGRSYDKYKDSLPREKYIVWLTHLFKHFNLILEENRVVLFNMSYSKLDPSLHYSAITEIEKKTNFRVVDTICWVKPNSTPLSSTNRLTRKYELIFVFARITELDTFHINKKVTSISKNGKVNNSPIDNILYCKNGKSRGGNISTFSVELINNLIRIYGKMNDILYDPFMGTGTTAVSSLFMNCNFVGSEISTEQVLISTDRYKKSERFVKLNYLLYKKDVRKKF